GPHIVLLRSPLRILRARNLHFGNVQLAVTVRADVLDLRPPELEHPAPRSGLDWHPQPPQANTAAVPLIPDRRIQHSARDQKPYTDPDREPQIVREPGRHVAVREVLLGREQMVNQKVNSL